jgi:Fe-S-cluster containining protein
MSTLIQKDGFSFSFNPQACNNCQGRCCTGESGYIYVTKQEIKNIAELLELQEIDFVKKYLFKKMYKYSIKERKVGDSYECIFYDAQLNGCKIYEARPSQCKTFPFWDYYKNKIDELKLECPGIIDE